MGGKRPDQYNIDPAEGSSSDHKWRHEGRSADERTAETEKRHLAENPHDQPMIPEERVNPALRELRDRKQARHEAGETAENDEPEGMSADKRVDEASKESFPASDPPAY